MSISIFALNTAGWVGYMTPGAGESFWILYQYLHYTVPQKLFFLAKKQWSQKSIAPPGVFTEETRMWEISQNEDRPMPSLSPKSHNILIKRWSGSQHLEWHLVQVCVAPHQRFPEWGNKPTWRREPVSRLAGGYIHSQGHSSQEKHKAWKLSPRKNGQGNNPDLRYREELTDTKGYSS